MFVYIKFKNLKCYQKVLIIFKSWKYRIIYDDSMLNLICITMFYSFISLVSKKDNEKLHFWVELKY